MIVHLDIVVWHYTDKPFLWPVLLITFTKNLQIYVLDSLREFSWRSSSFLCIVLFFKMVYISCNSSFGYCMCEISFGTIVVFSSISDNFCAIYFLRNQMKHILQGVMTNPHFKHRIEKTQILWTESDRVRNTRPSIE